MKPNTRRPDRQDHSDLTSKAYQAIRHMLFCNQIMPGQKIKYRDLAALIGVSMTPVIQALKWLEFRNIVRHEPNKGYYVNEVSSTEIREIYDTRLLIEVSLVPDIMKHMDEKGIETLKHAHTSYARAVDENKHTSRMITDMNFHMALASLSGCRIQLKMLDELFDVLLLRYNRDLFFLSLMETSLEEHATILKGLEEKDEQQVTNTLHHHIKVVRDHIIEGMERLSADETERLSVSMVNMGSSVK